MPRRKIPKKAELIQLQKLYKTDEKIAERLGNVSPQLVAYWRRKKNIPKHLFAKFSADDVRDLWERFGDDYRCGLELGISKAAFYNWRRKYGFKEKPAFLKLEQLELNLGGPENGRRKTDRSVTQTITQKIFAGAFGTEKVEAGQSIIVEPDLVMLSVGTEQVIDLFGKSGLNYVWNPNRVIIALNDFSKVNGESVGAIQKKIRDFSRRQNLKYLYEAGEGCGYQLVIEKGNILPGQLAFGVSSHISACGCIGALGLETNHENMAGIWAVGKYELKVPRTVRIIINGHFPRGVFARDAILFISKKLVAEEICGCIIEFYGTTISVMSISERFTLTSLASHLGAVSAIVPYDSITRRYFAQLTNMPYRPALADKNADYARNYEFNIDNTITPQILCSGNSDSPEIVAVAEKEGISLNQVIIGSETNGRFDDLRVVAEIIKGRKIHPDIRMMVYPGSRSIYLEALKRGIIRAMIEAGANVMCPGSIPDLISSNGYLAAGEVCLATTGYSPIEIANNRHIKIYQASPATAAASALKGVITDPTDYLK